MRTKCMVQVRSRYVDFGPYLNNHFWVRGGRLTINKEIIENANKMYGDAGEHGMLLSVLISLSCAGLWWKSSQEGKNSRWRLLCNDFSLLAHNVSMGFR